jgi:DNA mismatch repair protein MutL
VIRILPDEVIDRIAAGEVVERPAAVVKELVENALDAGATKIEVHLEAGGRRGIRVADNGEGISPEDLKVVFQRHATSKLADVEDLMHIVSLGFRGEALSSIGAVSRAQISSRRHDAEEGFLVKNQGGEVTPPRPTGSPPGTTVDVKNLFYNVPARSKFLKTEATELSHCVTCVTRFALACPEKEFALLHNGKKVFHAARGGDRLTRIAEFFGKETADRLIPVNAEVLGIDVEGFLGKPELARRDQRRCFLFLNGRYIKDRAVHAAIRRAYQEVMPAKFQPVYFLHLGMPPDWVDVNVHPTKIEVRFLDGARVFSALFKTAREALAGGAMLEAGAPPPSNAFTFTRRPVSTKKPAYGGSYPSPGAVGEAHAGLEEARTASEGEASKTLFPRASDEASKELFETGHESILPDRILQILDTYAVFETPQGFALVDQHALHERVLYESLRKEYESGGIQLQQLLMPATVDLDPSLAAMKEELCFDLGHLGIRAEPFGRNTLKITALPALLGDADPRGLVNDVLDRLALGQLGEDAYRALLHRMACRGAVKSGHRLTAEELRALLVAAGKIDFYTRCPHGRPTTVLFSLAEIESMFKRRGF